MPTPPMSGSHPKRHLCDRPQNPANFALSRGAQGHFLHFRYAGSVGLDGVTLCGEIEPTGHKLSLGEVEPTVRPQPPSTSVVTDYITSIIQARKCQAKNKKNLTRATSHATLNLHSLRGFPASMWTSCPIPVGPRHPASLPLRNGRYFFCPRLEKITKIA